jgi:dihydropteroate synthase
VAGEAGVGERLPGSLACACWGAQQGVSIVRTHDVAATRQALRVGEAILARRSGGSSSVSVEMQC